MRLRKTVVERVTIVKFRVDNRGSDTTKDPNDEDSALNWNNAATSALRSTIRYDTIAEFNVDSKAEYSALSSTRSQKKKKLRQKNASVPLIQYRTVKIREVSPEGIRVTTEERIYERDEF